METQIAWRSLPMLVALALASVVSFTPVSASFGLTPESPEVQKAIGKAIAFLESDKGVHDRVGGKALVGLTMLKYGSNPNHPRVAQAVEAIKAAINTNDPATAKLDIYSTGLSIIFLVTLDPSKYSAEIVALLRYLESVQKPHGGWGYPDRETGDTSMTQYGVLSSWEAKQAGFAVPPEMIERVTDWLLRTQDPEGSFGYQGKVAADYNRLEKQSEVKLSMGTAGTGSVYICSELLGMTQPAREDSGLPPGLKKVKKQNPQDQAWKSNIDVKVLRRAQSRGNSWIRANFKVDPPGFTHYYLYALERYWSFREAAEGKVDQDVTWYNEGARYLIRNQAADGSWTSQSGIVPDTAFGVLFLLRSMKKSIEKARSYGSGTLVGGRGLPKDTSSVKVHQGKVVTTAQLGALEQVLEAIDDPENPDFSEAIESLSELPPEAGKSLLSKHAEKLRQLAGGNSPEARIAAIRALARTGDLDHVPTLVYALQDQDLSVMREARAGLERLSRRFTGFGPPDQASDEERRKAIQAWKLWYLAVRPDAEFEEP
jgi:hypothetical protein